MAEWRSHPRLEFGIKVMNKSNNEASIMSINAKMPSAFEIPGEDEYEAICIEVDGKVVHHGKVGEGMGINFVIWNLMQQM